MVYRLINMGISGFWPEFFVHHLIEGPRTGHRKSIFVDAGFVFSLQARHTISFRNCAIQDGFEAWIVT